jgi:methyltransferase (TIGR00027 family)
MIPAQPSRTAWRVALRRAAHQLIDRPPVLVDPLAIPVLGGETAAAIRADPSIFERGRLSGHLRAFFAARSRFAEDQLAAARRCGVTQYVILGAGLDTFASRDPDSAHPVRVWEVDHPGTQAWKRDLLSAAMIPIPANLTFVPVDFEHDTLPERLEGAGFDPSAGAILSWLGVVPYLTQPAIRTTLEYVARVTSVAGGITFDFGIPPDQLSPPQRAVFEALAERVRAAGEPWQTFYDPATLVRDLHDLGFAVAEDVTPAAINRRYFADRTDGLAVGGIGHLMWAGSGPVVSDSEG